MSIGSLVRTMIDFYQSRPYQPLRPAVRWAYRKFRHRMTGRQVIETIDGVKFSLDLSETIDCQLYYYGAFEKETKAALLELCEPGYTVLDIGANIGAHTFFLARSTGPTGCVHAFEPASYAHGRLNENIQLNPHLRVIAHHFGLGARESLGQETEVSCRWPVDRSFERRPGQLLPNARVERDCIDIVRLDDFAKSAHLDSIDLVKLDVDGHEQAVIQGGRDSILRHKPIIVTELCDYTLRAYGSSARGLCRELEDIGYELFQLDLGSRLQMQSVHALERSDHDSINIVALHSQDTRPAVIRRCERLNA